MLRFDEDVEIDKSLYCRKIKYNRGDPTGHRIWISVIGHRRINTLILYLVDNIDTTTPVPLIQKHVAQGTTIFSKQFGRLLGIQ